MKLIFVLAFVVVSVASYGADVAFQIYTNDASGIPNGWPLTQPRPLGGTNAPAATNEVVMTDVQFTSYLAALQPAKAAWNATHKVVTTVPNPIRTQQLLDTISDFQLAISNWASLTAVQQKAVLLRCVQVLKIMLEEKRVDLEQRQ